MTPDDKEPKAGERFSYEESREEQDEFEGLLRDYHGDFQAAVDAQRRGEKPKHIDNASEG